MSETAEHTGRPILNDVQKNAIVGLSDIRRRSQMLTARLDSLTRKDSGHAYKDQVGFVSRIMQDDAPGESISTEQTASHLQTASEYRHIAPNLAALHFAKAADSQQEAGLPYTDALEQAKKCLDLAEQQGIPRNTPADFLPDAYVLRIAKRAAKGVALPSPQTVAHATESDPSLLKDYALVLPEDQRDEFLSALPETKRFAASVEMDQAVSKVLDRKLITESRDIEQRDAVKNRVNETFAHALETLKSPDSREQGFGGRTPGSRWSGRQLTETLVNLGEIDSLQLLRDLTQQTSRELKAANKAKHLKKKSPEQKAEALQPFLSFTGRVLNTLIEADTKRGGVLAMRYLEMSALPEHYFTFFAQKLVEEDYFTKNLSPFLGEEENTAVLKKLMANYGPQFNTIVDTLAQIPDYKADHQLEPRKEELFGALGDLETLTPRIFERYRSLPSEQRKDFSEKIKTLKPQFFRNVPIKRILDPSERDILTEMVYVAYKPQGMSFEQVDSLIGKIDDHTDDLARYKFPEDGYPLTLERRGAYVVKEKEQVDLASLRRYKNLFAETKSENIVREQVLGKDPFFEACESFLRSELQASQRSDRDPNEMLRILLEPVQSTDRVQEFRQRHSNITEDTAHNATSELAEITDVYFRDTYADRLRWRLVNDPKIFEKFTNLLNDASVRGDLNDRLKQWGGNVRWQELDDLSRSESPYESAAFMANVVTQLIQHEQMDPIRKSLQSELSKFTYRAQGESTSKQGSLKAYVSKNVGSFFAKAAAGICTASDIPLFERDDHFHINVVEDDETVRANNQAYIADVGGKPSLILRGFNPTADWVGKIDVESYCEEVLRVGREFQEDNGLDGVYITDQDGGWHALSNREQPAKYLVDNYVKGKSATPFHLQVSGGNGSGGHSVNKIYKI